MTTPVESRAGRITLDQVPVPGRRLAVRRAGPERSDAAAEPPVLLLHGVPQTSLCWVPLMEELGRDRTVLAPDLPGLGESEIRGPYDVRSVAASLIALLASELDVVANAQVADGPGSNVEAAVAADSGVFDEDGPEDDAGDRRVDLVGHDWGGSLALAVAAARPDLVRRVVVISAPYRTVDVTRAWHIPLFGFLPPVLFAHAGRALVRGMFRYAWKTGRPPAGLVEAYADAYATPERVRAMVGYYRAAVRRSATKDGDGSGEPSVRAERSLVVWGTVDPPMPLRVGESVVSDLGRVNDPATVQMTTLPGVGHWPLDEVPDVVVPLVADFLRRS